ncbi:heme exporter protein CcmB [Selenihalanaerobacter shriftii]|uniref:Heme exporter protein B n=1 Tax=Selenihalanaerobacter shriftii TaxID=142842 RepID=A0A1T4PQI9_9FIRM|nr:heme exporter protein CcmB [Selenihalanaerobacter shriftii]SJZ93148.1 heme exporter protein B [Selenihalanaerobacter shriftii]
MTFFKQVKALVWKDLKSEFRTKEMLSAMLIFAFLVIVIFSFAFDPTDKDLQQVFPGIIWVAFIFSGILGLNRSFVSEKKNNSIQGLMLCPADRSVIYFGKVITNLILMLIVEFISLPIFIILFDYRFSGSILKLVLVILLGTFGFVSIGTFLAALTANTRTSEVLLPIILFPVVVPLIIGAVESTEAIFIGKGISEILPWLKILGIYDLIFITVPFMLFEFLLEV